MRPCFFHRTLTVLLLRCVLGLYLGLAGCGSNDDLPETQFLAASKTLTWMAASEPSVLGYKLYWGTMSGRYDSQVDVGPDPSYTLRDLKPGTTYYFAVSAYNAGGESALSEEISSVVE